MLIKNNFFQNRAFFGFLRSVCYLVMYMVHVSKLAEILFDSALETFKTTRFCHVCRNFVLDCKITRVL